MTLIRILFWFIVFYSLFKILVRVVIPLMITTRTVRARMKDMRQNMESYERNNNTTTPSPEAAKTKETTATAGGDYIDFEEVK